MAMFYVTFSRHAIFGHCYYSYAMDIHSHLSKRSENILEEIKSRLMDLRCKSDLNVMFVYWCRLFNASIASVLGMAAMAIHLLTCPQKSEYVHQSNLLVFS